MKTMSVQFDILSFLHSVKCVREHNYPLCWSCPSTYSAYSVGLNVIPFLVGTTFDWFGGNQCFPTSSQTLLGWIVMYTFPLIWHLFSVFGGLVQEVGMSTSIFQRWNFFPIVGVAFSDINADFVYSEFDITTWVLHLNRVLNKDEGTLYLICPFFVFTSGFTSQLLMNTYVSHPT